jgi:hypothetical protein
MRSAACYGQASGSYRSDGTEWDGRVERETGFEPATACLEGRNSTTELLPHGHSDRTLTMAVRTDDIALRYLGQYR